MKDLKLALDDRPGALAEVGEALGAAGVSVEGGAAFALGVGGLAHFLVVDAEAARAALEERGIGVLDVRNVVTCRLDQASPGQLGRACRDLGSAGVNIEVLYSDHDHRLVVVVDDEEIARDVLSGLSRG